MDMGLILRFTGILAIVMVPVFYPTKHTLTFYWKWFRSLFYIPAMVLECTECSTTLSVYEQQEEQQNAI